MVKGPYAFSYSFGFSNVKIQKKRCELNTIHPKEQNEMHAMSLPCFKVISFKNLMVLLCLITVAGSFAQTDTSYKKRVLESSELLAKEQVLLASHGDEGYQ